MTSRTCAAVIGYACNKNVADTQALNKDDLFVRIASVDKDGTTNYSKIVKAIKE